ncbi:MAG: tetratricopeptide repeat protein [Pirellulaceae bacterium]
MEAQERAQDAERIALENAEAERAAKQEALAQQSRAEQTAEFLVGIFQAADSLGLNGVPFFIPRNTGEQLTVNDLLSRGKERIEQDLVQDPAIRASILNSIGNAFRFSGELEQAQEALEESLRIRRELVPPNEADIAKSAHNLAFTLHELGLYDQAEELYREALEIQRRLDGGESPETASIEFNLAWLIGQAGNPEESAELMRHVIEVRKEQGDPRLLSIAQIGLAIALLETGDKAGAALPLTAAQLRLNSLEGNSLLSSAVFEFAWGYIDPFGGQAHFQKALENVKATLGDQHIYTGFAHYLIAEKLAENDKFDEALVHMEQAWAIAESQTRLRHPRIVFLANLYGYVLTQLDRRSEAHVRWQTFLEAQEAAFGIESPRCAEAWYEYALFCNSRTEATTRRDAFKIAVDGFASVPVEEIPPSLLRSYEDASYRLALLLVNQGSREDAEEWFARCESLRPLVASSTDHDGLYARAERVSNLSRLGRHDDAIRLAEEYHDHLSHLDVTGEKARDLREHYYRTEVVCYANAQRWSDSLARFEDYRQHVEPDADGWFRFSQLAASAGKFCLTSNESEQALSFRSLAIEGLQKAVDLGWRDWDSLRGNSNFEPWLEDQVFLDAFPRLRNDTSSETRIRDLATETPAGDN